MNGVEIKIKFLENNKEKKLPFYATSGAAGMDLTACLDESITLKPLERALIPTGIAISLPSEKYGAFLFARSGLASKHGITLANCVGVVDSDYTGEIKVALVNLSNNEYTIENGERVAQMVIMEVAKASFTVAEELDKTQRGSGGFGSTGKN
ncbi:MAG: dUTP diphosphatase [Clostridia bacterium]|nr:dUTP diphosphatase [Clostridia bacterium]MBO7289452.1 dUTP diphosphatase [Clostridia bacterium]